MISPKSVVLESSVKPSQLGEMTDPQPIMPLMAQVLLTALKVLYILDRKERWQNLSVDPKLM